MPLSVTIITKNAATTITRCLSSVSWADEIIIVDSGSTDNTLEVARRYTDKIFQTDWPGYGIQKNRAIDKAQYDWILSIDADEYVTTELAEEIKVQLKNPQANAYQIKVQLVFNQKIIKHAVGSDLHTRLFNKRYGRFTETPVHEHVTVSGKVGTLKNYLLHDSFKDIDCILRKMNHYSSLSAQHRIAQGKRVSAWLALPNAIWTFTRLYFLKGGFLDGKEGLVLAFSFAEGAFYRYMKTIFLKEITNE